MIDDNDDYDESNERYLPFRSIRDFFAQVNACTEETFLIFSGVSAAQYEATVKSRDRRGLKFKIDLWDGGELWVTAGISAAHGTLHGFFDDEIYRQVCGMGLYTDWKRTASTNYLGNSSGGQGDSSRKPRSQRPSPTAWPTLVLEAGYSQSMRKLRLKARWWFRASNHEVKIVILTKLFRTSKRIVVEKWTEVLAPQPTAGVTTRAQCRQLAVQTPTPNCAPKITIEPFPGTTLAQMSSSNSFQVVRAPLVLEFSLLFLRQPGQGENDISLGAQTFQAFAAQVWEDVV
ncbi:hypothetical protein QBC46DRAFT_374384 [Diplogelasinospora grovesii]|uniref:Uncharacterized protein n=1 Tax=Diplogelasinospora grovesii TaxID=303347 RepID=A0AAN6S8Z5_9PEZI|nr:hypothetical protein QBC46DRAFT_374384 [Diplogelasinospora grovesii]